MKQMIISIGREFGSAGHEIAKLLAEHYELPLYDHNLLKEIAAKRNLESEKLEEFDEVKRNKFLYRSVKGMSSSPADNVANLQFEFLREKAGSGESFVVVGRCSETILKANPGLISFFIIGDIDKKLQRIMKLYKLNEKEALALIAEKNKKRRQYHDSHCNTRWGDAAYYDMTLNSSKLGLDGSVALLTQYIDSLIRIRNN